MKTAVDPASIPNEQHQSSPASTQSFIEDPLRIATILVPIDFSDDSFRAVEYAQAIAKRGGATLHLVYVYNGEHQFSSLAAAPELLDDWQIAERLQRELQRRFSIEVPRKNCHVRAGRPFQEIVASAKELEADLIVVATHGQSGLRHLALGSTAEKVVRHARCPILVVRERCGRVLEKTNGAMLLKKIVVPVDFSECAREGARYAAVFASKVGADILLMHVVSPPELIPVNGFVTIRDRSRVVESMLLNAEDRLDQLVNFLPLEGITAETLVEVGAPVEKLVEVTKRSDIDMVVTSTHGYSALRHALLGSTAEQLVCRAHAPVLVVPSHCRQVPQ